MLDRIEIDTAYNLAYDACYKHRHNVLPATGCCKRNLPLLFRFDSIRKAKRSIVQQPLLVSYFFSNRDIYTYLMVLTQYVSD